MKTAPELRPSGRSTFGLALRIARRDAAQHRGRSALIIVLIAIPIIGLSGIATITSSNQPTTAEQLRNELGSTQAALHIVAAPGPGLQQDPVNAGNFNNSTPSTATSPLPTELPSAFLPAGTRILTLRDVAVIATTATGIGSMSATVGEPWDSAFRGRFAVLSGHTPTSPGEIMVTPAALTRLGKQVGEKVSISAPRTATFTIVGTMRDLTETTAVQKFFAMPSAIDDIAPIDSLDDTTFYLPSLSLSWKDVQALNQNGITAYSRAVVLDPPPVTAKWEINGGGLSVLQTLGLLSPVFGFSLFEVGLLAGAAFMVGTKRQERSLATLASVGGDRRMLSRVVSSAGIVLGLAGGVLGSALGIVAAWTYMQTTSGGSLTAFPGLHVDPWVTLGIILFATLAGWIAALIPARRAARIDVVASLRGSARPPRPDRRAPIAAVIVALAGVAVTVIGSALLIQSVATQSHDQTLNAIALTLVIVGPITLQIAALIIAPTILRGVGWALARLGTAARLASRDAARNASRSVPAVGAIMSTIFISSFLITYLAAAQASATAEYEYHTAPGLVSTEGLSLHVSKFKFYELTQSVKAILHTDKVNSLNSALNLSDPPDSTGLFPIPMLDPAVRCTQLPDGPDKLKPGSLSITSPDCQGPYYLTQPSTNRHIFVATPAAIERVMGVPLSAAALAAYNTGKVVVFYPQYVKAGGVTINWYKPKQLDDLSTPQPTGGPAKSVTLPAVLQKLPHDIYIDMVMSPALASASGIHVQRSEIIANVKTPLTDAQRDALSASVAAIGGVNGTAYFYYEGGPSNFPTTAQWGLLALCLLISLGASAIAIGLARSEGQRDEAVLGTLGAPPRLRRWFSMWSAVVITGVGSIGGVLLGTIPAAAIAQSLVQPGGRAAVPFELPWAPLLLAALGLPLVIALGAWITAGRARIQYNVRAPIE